MGEVFAGRYELVDPLASGGAGVIWRVWDLREREYRAGKVLKQSDSASLLRFMRETSWRISHPHVVTPLGWVGEDDRVMFTMPLVRGGSLSALLKSHGPLPPAWAVQATDQLLAALEKVHAQGLVHRDVKPANILLTPATAGAEPDIKLTDFGIAATVGDPRMTRVTEVIGTPGYMSPEAAYGLDPEPRQDLYSVGVVLLEMLTGQRPPKEGLPEVPRAAAGVPLGKVIAKLLADETERYTTAAQARAALAEAELPNSRVRPVEIVDVVPTLPDGWGPVGPTVGGGEAGATRVVPRNESFTPTHTRSAWETARAAGQTLGPGSAPSQDQPRRTTGGQPVAQGPGSQPPPRPFAAMPGPAQQGPPPGPVARPPYGAPVGMPGAAPTINGSRPPQQPERRGFAELAAEISPWVWAALVIAVCVLIAVLIYVNAS